MSALSDKLKKLNTIKGADLVSNSKFFVEQFYDTGIPILNLAFSSHLDGGLSTGCHILAGESKTFKTMFALCAGKHFLEENPDGLVVVFDCEYGFSKNSIESVGLDPSKVLHKPIESVEDLTHDITVLLKGIDPDDKVLLIVDSYGEIASNKEIADAVEGKNVVDMTRAKSLNSHFRIIRPLLQKSKSILLGIGGIYHTQEMYSKVVIKGGAGILKCSDQVFVITQQKLKEKDSRDVVANSFNLSVYKGRLVRENSRFSVTVSYEEGIDKYSGIFDLGIATGHIERPTTRSYSIPSLKLSGFRKALETPENLQALIEDPSFKEAVHKKYSLGTLDQSTKSTNIQETSDND